MEAARDWELLSLNDFSRYSRFQKKRVPLCLHECPHCGDELDPRSSRNMDELDNWSFICYEWSGH